MTEATQRADRLVLLVFVYVTSALIAIRAGALLEPVGTDAVMGWALAIGFARLCAADARILRKPISPLAQVGIVFTWPIGAPLYLLWARGLRGLGWALLHAVLLLILGIVLSLSTSVLCYGWPLL